MVPSLSIWLLQIRLILIDMGNRVVDTARLDEIGSYLLTSDQYTRLYAMTIQSLSALQLGQKGIICGYLPEKPAYRQQLLSMGLTPETPFQVIRRAPMGDPIQLRIRGSSVCLRLKEAQILLVKPYDVQ